MSVNHTHTTRYYASERGAVLAIRREGLEGVEHEFYSRIALGGKRKHFVKFFVDLPEDLAELKSRGFEAEMKKGAGKAKGSGG